MNIQINIDLETVIEDLVSSGQRHEALDFIKAVDLKMADWDFTIALAEHFNSLLEQYKKETSEEAALHEKTKSKET